MNDLEIEKVIEAVDTIKAAGMPEGAFTTRDVVVQLGCGGDKASGLIRDAIELGLCEYIGNLPRPNRIGGTQSVPHYKWTDNQKGEGE